MALSFVRDSFEVWSKESRRFFHRMCISVAIRPPAEVNVCSIHDNPSQQIGSSGAAVKNMLHLQWQNCLPYFKKIGWVLSRVSVRKQDCWSEGCFLNLSPLHNIYSCCKVVFFRECCIGGLDKQMNLNVFFCCNGFANPLQSDFLRRSMSVEKPIPHYNNTKQWRRHEKCRRH